MPTLKDVAATAKVPLLTAYHALSNAALVEDKTRQTVIDAAVHLGYRLNITIRDVADHAGVSIATVSYVLNDSAPVSAATRQRVVEAVASLGYRPNITARNLKASETRMIGYAWHDVPTGQMNAVLDRFLYCMAQAAESHGYHVLTFTLSEHSAVKAYEDLIHINRVDGFVVSDTNRDDARIRRLMQMGVPFVAFGRANDDWNFSYVDVDGRCGVRIVVEHLLERGHRQIAFLGWPEGSLAGDARYEGYLDALTMVGITPPPDWIVRTYNSVADASHAAQRLMSLPERPTAIVCVSDMIAIGAMSYLDSAGFQVGVDVAVTGFDDHPMAEFLRPPLTSLRQPIERLARQVIDLLMAEIDKRPIVERRLLLAPVLIIRESSSQKFG